MATARRPVAALRGGRPGQLADRRAFGQLADLAGEAVAVGPATHQCDYVLAELGIFETRRPKNGIDGFATRDHEHQILPVPPADRRPARGALRDGPFELLDACGGTRTGSGVQDSPSGGMTGISSVDGNSEVQRMVALPLELGW